MFRSGARYATIEAEKGSVNMEGLVCVCMYMCVVCVDRSIDRSIDI